MSFRSPRALFAAARRNLISNRERSWLPSGKRKPHNRKLVALNRFNTGIFRNPTPLRKRNLLLARQPMGIVRYLA
jgi:hypothetical protein